ncbi:hypothetical protein MRX96_018720 [Rhipicephalus microplus]
MSDQDTARVVVTLQVAAWCSCEQGRGVGLQARVPVEVSGRDAATVLVPTLQVAAWSTVRATWRCRPTGMSSSGRVRPERGCDGGANCSSSRLVCHASNPELRLRARVPAEVCGWNASTVVVPGLQVAAWSIMRTMRSCWATGMSFSGGVRSGRRYSGGAYPSKSRLIYCTSNGELSGYGYEF